jgi:hypothetical protein
MASPQRASAGPVLELHAGCARWLRCSHVCVSLLGLAGILGSGARPAWTAAAVVALVLVHFATARRMNGHDLSGRLRLFADGSGAFVIGGSVVAVLQHGGGWLSRWFCVVPLERLSDGRRIDAVVCRSLNAPDDYRRLLVRLRMHEAHAPGHELTWS